MTCNNCIHYMICDDGYALCENFKDKSKFIELPLKPGDRAYVVLYRSDFYCYIGDIEVRDIAIASDFIFVTASQGHGETGFIYGTDVFATRKEAEQRKMELDND